MKMKLYYAERAAKCKDKHWFGKIVAETVQKFADKYGYMPSILCVRADDAYGEKFPVKHQYKLLPAWHFELGPYVDKRKPKVFQGVRHGRY